MDSELVDVLECLITKREMEDTLVRFSYTVERVRVFSWNAQGRIQ